MKIEMIRLNELQKREIKKGGDGLVKELVYLIEMQIIF